MGRKVFENWEKHEETESGQNWKTDFTSELLLAKQ